MNRNVTAIILAGGKSRRMGKDKGLIEFNGLTLVEHILNSVKPICNDVMIASSQKKYNCYGVKTVSDIYKEQGPIGGIHSGLYNSKTTYNFVVGCDMPFVSPQLISFLITNIDEHFDVIVPTHQNKIEPMCGIYSKRCINKLELFIQQKKLAMFDIVKSLHTKYVNVDSSLSFYSANIFANFNTAQELKSYQKISANEN